TTLATTTVAARSCAPVTLPDPYNSGQQVTYDNPCITNDMRAVCSEDPNKPHCTCSYTSTGDLCETVTPQSEWGRCKNYNGPNGFATNRCTTSYDQGNVCDPDETKPWCTCTPSWTGEYCETAVTTTTETSTTTTETSTTTSEASTTTGYMDRCGKYTGTSGTIYDNRCMTKDRGAQCSTDPSQPLCECSIYWIGMYCAADAEAFERLAGNATDGLIDTIDVGRTNPATVIAALPAILSFLTDEQRLDMSYAIEDVIMDATFEEQPLVPSEAFTFFNDPSLGNCFTFNHFNATEKYQARGAGARYGLRVTLEFGAAEYAPWVEAVGVLTYIHPIGQNIYLESVKHTNQPGNSDQIAMKKHSFKRLQAPFAPACVARKDVRSFYFPGEYSVDGCLRSCYQDSVFRSCGCMDPQYTRKDGVPSCNFEKLACIEEM
ncbi:hypothetical protein PMAYCL1PPCAC_00994, partial [Pristionchus mayeri]